MTVSMAPAKSVYNNRQKTKAQQQKTGEKSHSAKTSQEDAKVDCGKKKGKNEPAKPENAATSKSKLAMTKQGRKDESENKGKKIKDNESGKVKRDQKSNLAQTKKEALKQTGKGNALNGKSLPAKETKKDAAGKGGIKKAVNSKQVKTSAVKFGKKEVCRLAESSEEESEIQEESSEQEQSTESPEASEGAETDDEESVGIEVGKACPEEEPPDTENDVEDNEVEEEDVDEPAANSVPRGEPEKVPSSSSGDESESEQEHRHSDDAEENDPPSKSTIAPKKAGPLKLTTRLLRQGGKVKSKNQLKKETIPTEKLKPAPPATKAFRMKGLVLHKNVQDKGKSQILQLAKAAKTTKDKPEADREEEKTASTSKSTLISPSHMMLTLKLKKKQARANQDSIAEPTTEEQTGGAAKGKQSTRRPQNIGLVLGKVKMASLRCQARKKQRESEDTAAVEHAEETSSQQTDSLITSRKGMTTLRRVSGWIQKKIPTKSVNIQDKVTAFSRAISISTWLTTQALKRQNSTTSSKKNLFRQRMAIRFASAASLKKKDQLPESETNLTMENGHAAVEIEDQEDSSDDGSSQKASESQSEAEEKANAGDAKYAIVFPRMHKIGKAKGGSSASTTSAASASTEPKRVPPKPGARLVLPVKPDLTVLKSIKRNIALKEPAKNVGPTGNAGEKELQGTVESRKSLLEEKAGLSALQAARGKIGPSQLKLTKLTMPKPLSGTGIPVEQGSNENDKEKPGGSAVEVEVNRQRHVSSSYEEEADREVAELMGEGAMPSPREVHWAQGRPLCSDPHDWLRAETLLPHQTVEKLSKWTAPHETEQSQINPNYNGRGPWEAEDASQNMLESRLSKTQVFQLRLPCLLIHVNLRNEHDHLQQHFSLLIKFSLLAYSLINRYCLSSQSKML